MKIFKRKKIQYIEYEPSYGDTVFINFKGTIVELGAFNKRPKMLYIDGKYQAREVLDVDDIRGAIELVEDALLLEDNDILSGAFEVGSRSHHLTVDYHRLTIMGDDFDRKVRTLKKSLGDPHDY
jgi:hypothetical protein